MTYFQISRALPRAVHAVLFIAAGLLSACSGSDTPPVATLNNPVEGIWKIAEDKPPLRITPCGQTAEDGFCGRYLELDDDKIDWMNPDMFEWGQSIQNTTVVRSLRETDQKGVYAGTFYSPDMGEYLVIQLTLQNRSEATAKIYFGPLQDEAVDMLITSALAPLSAVNLTWYLTRASVGKELLSRDHKWTRLTGGKK